MYDKHFGLAELPFSVTPDPRFSYVNSDYREAFATLRYGIETRKGFIVITGEAGTGKTTLLRRLMHSVEATVHTAFIFNTHLSFIELLRLVLNELGVANSARDKQTLMARLNDYLIEQLHKDHIVSLLIDEAQNLSDEMLEELRLLSNLETDRAKLIQIVLIGQPELERKLEQTKLWQLKQRVAVRSRLAPLRSEEVAAYINSRLHTVGYQGKELFDPGSVQKIALFSKGIPRLINAICDNALLIAYATSRTKISAKIVDEVARDLQLGSPQLKTAERNESFRRTKAQYHDKPGRSEVEEFPAVSEQPWREPRHKRSWAGAGIAIALGLIILAGTVLYSQQSGSLAALGVNIDDLVGGHLKNLVRAQAKPAPEPIKDALPEERVTAEQPRVPTATEQAPELSASDPKQDDIASAKIENDAGRLTTPPDQVSDLKSQSSTTPSNQTAVAAKTRKQTQQTQPFFSDAPATAEKLEFEILKAIYNRAIRGVEVSVRDGTVFLTGQVATEKQKLAAALAARSVPGVKEVRDQVTVSSPMTPHDSEG
jgi:type II secretory pathway predicted ATPase ExeA